MASYFVARPAPRSAARSVHDRSRCAPGVFPLEGAEYLGEFLDVRQALVVARVRYPQACPCTCCAEKAAASTATPALATLKS